MSPKDVAQRFSRRFLLAKLDQLNEQVRDLQQQVIEAYQQGSREGRREALEAVGEVEADANERVEAAEAARLSMVDERDELVRELDIVETERDDAMLERDHLLAEVADLERRLERAEEQVWWRIRVGAL